MRHIALSFILTGLVAAPVAAQVASDGPASFNASLAAAARLAAMTQPVAQAPTAAAAPEPAPKKVTVLVGADFPSLYYFRGIRQEFDAGLTMQPYLDLGVAASPTVSLNFGTWNSFHGGSNKDVYDNAWYESDIYGSATFTHGQWKPGVLFTAYTSPANGFDTVSELALSLAYDDSGASMPMSPKVTLAFELGDGQADLGLNKGIYLEAGIKPSAKLGESATFYLPVKIGLGLKDYYEFSGGTGKLGFFDIGASVGMPLGKGEVHGGIDFFAFGDATREYNVGKRGMAVASVGFSVTY